MISSAGQLKCRKCGYIRAFDKKDTTTITQTRAAKEITIVEDGKMGTMPTTTIKCPKCSHNTAYWWLRQLRAADESEVRFFRCEKCEHTWRQYD
jgi:DNA-directed RNA polymerase subunit M